MDIRQFIDDKPDYEVGKELEFLYQLHTGLLDKYIDIEHLPPYPVSINSREGQAVIKDMTARVIEEIGEGYESTTYALKMLDKNGYNFSIWSDDDYQLLLNHLQNSNEEQADALAFYFNLLLYSNIQPEDVYSYCKEKLNAKANNLSDCMNVGYALNIARVTKTKQLDDRPWTLLSDSIMKNYFDRSDYEKVNIYTPAFHKLGWYFHDIEAEMAWEMSYHLSVARNYLKNKPWKQTMELTDSIRYQGEIVYAFLILLGYFRYVGFTVKSLVQLRYCKHLVCEFRIRSHY